MQKAGYPAFPFFSFRENGIDSRINYVYFTVSAVGCQMFFAISSHCPIHSFRNRQNCAFRHCHFIPPETCLSTLAFSGFFIHSRLLLQLNLHFYILQISPLFPAILSTPFPFSGNCEFSEFHGCKSRQPAAAE